MGVPAKKGEVTESGCEILRFPSIKIQDQYVNDLMDKSASDKKKRGESRKSTEVDHLTVEDSKRMLEYFESKNNWMGQLLLSVALNTGRRAGDLLKLKWKMIYSPNGKIRNRLELEEEKTDKFATIHINDAFRQAVEKYIDKTNCDPSIDDYSRYVFENPKTGNPIDHSTYWRWLKKGQDALSIDYKVGTHSARKAFGWMVMKSHPSDQEALVTLQAMFNHSDPRVTKRYIGITKETIAKFYGDVGNVFTDYIVGDKEFADDGSPVVSLFYSDIIDIITKAYELGRENSNSEDIATHIGAVNEMCNEVMKRRK